MEFSHQAMDLGTSGTLKSACNNKDMFLNIENRNILNKQTIVQQDGIKAEKIKQISCTLYPHFINSVWPKGCQICLHCVSKHTSS